MLEENDGTNTPDTQDNDSGADPIRQLKGEFNRKNDKLSSQLEAMARSQEMLLSQIQSLTAPKPTPVAKDDFSKKFYSDPEATAAIIEERAERRVMDRLAAQNRTQSVVQSLTHEYPELADPNAEITKRAAAILATYSPQEQQDPRSFEIAVYKAATETAVKPRSKRDPDEFMGPSYGNPYGAPRKREKSEKQILSEMEPLAQALMGDLYNDPATQKRLVERTKRNFKQQETPLRIRKGK